MKLFHTNQRPAVLAVTLFVLVTTATTWGLSMAAAPRYVTSLSISVNRTTKQTTPDYQYDGYYAIQATDLFTQTLLSWFITPSVLLDVYTRAHVAPNITSLGELTGRFRARKVAPQNLVVQFTEKNHDIAAAIADAISAEVKERGSQLDTSSDGATSFTIVPATPVIVETTQNAPLNAVAALIASTLIGIAAVSTVRYMRS